jgi:hypothetical protein
MRMMRRRVAFASACKTSQNKSEGRGKERKKGRKEATGGINEEGMGEESTQRVSLVKEG